MPSHYKRAKTSEEIDKSLLTVIPDAPRVAEQGFPPNFTWDILPAKFYEAPIRVARSELNLSSNHEGSLLKPSVSSFDIISRSESLNNGDAEEAQEEEIVKTEVSKVDRPKSIK
jgi:hypothetical protein